MKVRAVIKRLESEGWYQVKGKKTSHRQFKHPSKPGKVTVSGQMNDEVPTWDTLKHQKASRLVTMVRGSTTSSTLGSLLIVSQRANLSNRLPRFRKERRGDD